MMDLVAVLTGGFLVLAGMFAGIRIAEGRREIPKKTPAASEPEQDEKDEREEARRSREIDEGIQNLMTFSVNGSEGFDAGGL